MARRVRRGAVMALSLAKIRRFALELDEASRSPWSHKIQANILSAAFAVTLLMNLTFLTISAIHWRWTSVAVQGLVFAGILYGAYFLFRFGDPVRALSTLAWVLLPALIYRTYHMGGAGSPSILGVIIAFTLFSLILPIRRAIFFSSLYLAVILAFVAIEYFGIHLKSSMPPDVQQAFRIFNILSILFVIFWMVFLFRHAHAVLVKEMIEQRDRRAMLFRVLAHDLASPLMVLGGQLEKLNGQDPHIEKMKVALGQIEDMIARAKSIELASTHGQNQIPDLVDLTEAVESSIERILLRGRAKEVHFRFESPPQEAVVAFNRSSLIYHVLENIFSNALKFSPRGGFVEVEALEKKDEWQLIISDQGPGFPPLFLDRLKVADPKIRRLGSEGEAGSGLGLLIVDAVMKVYGGHFQIENQRPGNEGSGGTIILTFKKGLRMGDNLGQ